MPLVRRRWWCVAAFVAALRPGPARAQEARPPPLVPTYTTKREPMPFLTVTGLSIFGSVYAASIPATAAIARSDGSKFSGSHAEIMAIPFAGPWLEAAGVVERQSSKGMPGLMAVGLLQIVGATLAVVGLVGRERRVPTTSLPVRTLRPTLTVAIGPPGLPGSYCVGLTGAL